MYCLKPSKHEFSLSVPKLRFLLDAPTYITRRMQGIVGASLSKHHVCMCLLSPCMHVYVCVPKCAPKCASLRMAEDMYIYDEREMFLARSYTDEYMVVLTNGVQPA